MNIAICVPCRDQVETGFAFDMAMATSYHVANFKDRVHLYHSKGTLICNQRQELVKNALIDEADWILFLDADMRFPKDVISRLLAHDVPVVAANYSTRRSPVKPVTFANASVDDRIYTRPESEGLEECFGTGMGVFMVRADIFKELPLPWFQIGYSPSLHDFVGEDIYFCRLLREAGHKIMIDHDLSKQVRHVGTWEFSTDHACVVAE
jgi:glycosyltransferase involved in cell wall biosynthesis